MVKPFQREGSSFDPPALKAESGKFTEIKYEGGCRLSGGEVQRAQSASSVARNCSGSDVNASSSFRQGEISRECGYLSFGNHSSSSDFQRSLGCFAVTAGGDDSVRQEDQSPIDWRMERRSVREGEKDACASPVGSLPGGILDRISV